MSTETWQDAANEIWKLFRETDAQLKKQFKETDERLDKRFRETDEQFKEIAEQFKETDTELDKRFKETSREINKLSGLFTNQWGKMIEALVRPNALKLFQDRGIKVYSIYRRVEITIDDHTMEIDILLDSKDAVVVIEAKSLLKVNDVDDFLGNLNHFLYFFPHYQGRRVYGAVAGLDIDRGADKYAYRQGLFVLNAIGGGIAQIKNDHKFKPTDFGSARSNTL